MKFAFFGTAPLALEVLNECEKKGMLPVVVIAGRDVPERRSKNLVPPIEKQWALERNIPVLQPEKLDAAFLAELASYECDVFIVASFGKILPKALLDMPPRGTINLHPSLLPRLRGPSPIRSAILNGEKEIGVSIMVLDHEMDHGPLIAQKKVATPYTPMRGRELDALLAHEGAVLLSDVLPLYFTEEIIPQEQNHDVATYCGFFSKDDSCLDLSGDPELNLRKIRAFDGWPSTFAFFKRRNEDVRALILDAHIEHGKLVIDTVKPEGKGEMSYASFTQGLH